MGILIVVLLSLGGLLACGPGLPDIHPLPGAGTARLQPIYDVSVRYPSLEIIVSGLSYRGLDLDVEMAFDESTLQDGDPSFEARARVLSVSAGGVPQAFEAPQAIGVSGSYDDGHIATGFFGPIRVGNAGLLIDLEGTTQDGPRRLTGAATLYGFPDQGTFAAVKRRRYLVAGSDLQAEIGKVAVVTVRYDAEITIENDVEITSSDAIARVEDGRPFIVNRFTYDNVQGLDPLGPLKTTFEYSTENLSNPLDLVIPPPGAVGDPGTAFVTRYGAAFGDVAVLDLKSGTVIDRIDLKPYARNRNGYPRPDQALLHDGLIYVTLQDADATFTEFMNGRVVIIDPVLRQVIQVIDLLGQNPFEALTYAPSTGLIYVGLAGLFPTTSRPATLSGGIETIDPVTRTDRGVLVDDDALGGNVSGVAIHSATRGYCLVSDASFHNFVKVFDPQTGEVRETIFDSASLVSSIELDGDGYLLVADSSFFEPRVLIFNAETGALVAALPARLPPFSFAILTRSLP
ncbi:MAG TPA: hypothetical protein VKF61_07755 [Candidatus Polarisedimenticolia bacterium]|nr:hypothetical protein [Candidatus Polarisedimenticolia bacterium]